MSNKTIRNIIVIGIGLTLGLAGIPTSRAAATNRWSKAELAAQQETLLQRMRAEGLTPENGWLKGRRVASDKYRNGLIWPYPRESFPYQWDFDDGTQCGISHTDGITDLRVDGGALKFTVSSSNAFLAWGNYDKIQPALRFGYGDGQGRLGPFCTALRMRIRQSQTLSAWQAGIRRYTGGMKINRSGDYINESPPVTIKGTNWQTVLIPFKTRPKPPYTGVQLLTTLPGNNVEIDWVEPCAMSGPAVFRKTFVLPSAVRWAKCSLAYSGPYKVYVNGRAAAVSPPYMNAIQVYNHDLDAELFQAGTNVVAIVRELGGFTCGGDVLLDGALVCMDGSYHRFDTDTTWTFNQALTPEEWQDEWVTAACNDSGWVHAVLSQDYKPSPIGGQPEDDVARRWFNPSWKGRLAVTPADRRSQPVFGSQEAVALNVSVPCHAAEEQEVTWQIFNEMGDGFHAADALVQQGKLELKKKSPDASKIDEALDQSGELKFPAGALPANAAYAVVFRLNINGQEVEKYRYEIAVCGPVSQPVVENPKDYTDGMELKLVWEMDAAAEPDPANFRSVDGNGEARPSTVVTTPLGRFRQPWTENNLGSMGGGACNYISYRYPIRHPGRPHVAIAEYPDDTERIQEMRLNEGLPMGEQYRYIQAKELGNDTAALGIENPLTGEIRTHHAVFFPSETTQTVTFLSIGGGGSRWKPERAARVGKIRIYEILNDLPMRRITDAPGKPKWLGQLSEPGPRCIMSSCFASPIAIPFKLKLIASDTPNFYRNWMITYINFIKRLRFAGENAYYSGQYMYEGVLYPGDYADHSAFDHYIGGSLKDFGVLMARMFEENGLAYFTSLQIDAFAHLTVAASDDDVARGMDTAAQVNKNGNQVMGPFSAAVWPNYVHPAGRRHFDHVIDEVIGLYGKEKGWKGIVFYTNEAGGPNWYSVGDPYQCSYDDVTIALFEQETGVDIPVDLKDTKRFSRRYAWLMKNAQKAWTDWRCRKILAIHEDVNRRLKQARADLQLIVYPQGMSYIWPPKNEMAGSPPLLPTIHDYARRGGLDTEALKNHQDIILAMNVQAYGAIQSWIGSGFGSGGGTYSTLSRTYAHDERCVTSFADDGKNGIGIRWNWYEAQPVGPANWVWGATSPESWPYPGGEFFADYWVNIFIRSNPALILHPLQDMNLWNGREWAMGRFAQAFRSIPAGKYERLHGQGRDVNVWMAVCDRGESVYGYIANPQSWEVESTVSFAPGTKVTDLINSREVQDASWKVTLAPYTMHTFRLAGAQGGERILGCTTKCEQGQARLTAMLADAETNLAENARLLEQAGALETLTGLVKAVRQAVAAGDYSTAYEIFSLYPYQVATQAAQDAKFSPFITKGWKVSRLMPKSGKLAEVPCVRLADNPGWKSMDDYSDHSGGGVIVRSVYEEADGIAYLGITIKVHQTGSWTLSLGHDGGCRMFVDGKPALCQPKLHNPIVPDRSKVTQELSAGNHEIMIALDTHHGMGWGIKFRFATPDGKPIKAGEFPVAGSP